jgi:hypothetical protein
MKVRHYLLIAGLAFGLTGNSVWAQTKEPETDVTVSESVLNTAVWAGFKYQEELVKAKKGDYNATFKLMDFSGTVDGRTALEHSVTLLELIVSGGDEPFALAVQKTKPKLRTVLLDRLQLAQGRTKKEELRNPMKDWAPKTWAALNGLPFPRSVNEMSSEKLEIKEEARKEQLRKENSESINSATNSPAATPTNTPAAPGAAKPRGEK